MLDANQSPRTGTYLSSEFGFDVTDLIALNLIRLPDVEVLAYAKSEARIVITEDLDFGRLYNLGHVGQVGVTIMRLEFQSTTAVNRLLHRFFTDPTTESIQLERSLVVLDDERDRVRGTIFRTD